MHHIVIKRYFNISSAVSPCCFKPEKILQYKKIKQVKLFSNQTLFYRLQFVIFFKVVAKFVEKSDKRLLAALNAFLYIYYFRTPPAVSLLRFYPNRRDMTFI